MPSPPELERSFRLLPSERVLWYGTPKLGAPRDPMWVWIPVLAFAIAAAPLCFALLAMVSGVGPARPLLMTALYCAMTGVASLLVPRYMLDHCEFLVTDKRVFWRRGPLRRSIDRAAISYARIRWHRSVPGVGHLELVRGVPFGPLARKQRIVLHDVQSPDVVYALIRGTTAGEYAGASDVRLTERLDPGEGVLWGGAPLGWSTSWREVATALLGVFVLVVGFRYGDAIANLLFDLETIGLRVRSWTWLFLFLGTGITWVVITSVGAVLFWWGTLRARALALDTEYLLTDRRLVIRRGRTELHVDRKCIVDVADTPAARGAKHLFLILDAPQARALADSGALRAVSPARDSVPPVLYDLPDGERVRDLILDRRPSTSPLAPAA